MCTESLHHVFSVIQSYSFHFKSLCILFLQLAPDCNKLVGEPGQVRLRLVRATADVRACAICCSGEMQLVRCQAQRNTQAHNSSSLQAPPQSIPLKKVSAQKSVPAYLIHSAIDVDFPCHIAGHKCGHRLMQTPSWFSSTGLINCSAVKAEHKNQ